jgi:ABC-type transport system involved in multi-copper enzyme maturation permease subunit
MTRSVALAWKEYRETRWFLWGGLALFVGPMVFELWANFEANGGLYTDTGEGMVLGLGGVLAVFLAVAVTSRDLRSPLDTFWRSRPIGTMRMMAVKYMVGLVILLAVTLVTMVFQETVRFFGLRYLGRFPLVRPFAGWVVFGHTFVLVLVYSLSFLIGCLVRQAAQAAILSVAAGLLIYFVPVLIPQLQVVGVIPLLTTMITGGQMNWGRYAAYVAAMLGGSGAAFVLSIAAVRGQWRVRADQRLIYWSLGGMLILLLAAAALSLHSNMPLLSKTGLNLPVEMKGWHVETIQCEGRSGVALLKQRLIGGGFDLACYAVCRLEMDGGRPRLGLPLRLPGGSVPAWGFEPRLVWSAEHSDRVQVLQTLGESRELRQGTHVYVFDAVSILTISLTGTGEPKITHRLDLPSLAGCGDVRIARAGGKLFVLKSRAWTLDEKEQDLVHVKGPHWSLTTIDNDATNGLAVVQTQEVERAGISGYPYTHRASPWDETVVELLPLGPLSPQERLRVSVELGVEPHAKSVALIGSRLVAISRDGLTVSEPQAARDLGDNRVAFARVGQYHAMPLVQCLDARTECVAVDAQAGIIYVSELFVGGMVTAYDVHAPTQPQRVGYYATSEDRFSAIAALPDGHALLAGEDFSIVRLPSR